MKYDSEAAAGGLISLIFTFLLAGVLFVVMGFGVDRMTLLVSKMYTDIAAAQMRFDVFSYQLMIFRLEPIILLLGVGINYWVNQIRNQSGSVMLGTLLMGAGEMIILTIVLMMFTLFGGGAMDFVVNFVNTWQFPVIQDMNFVIQYLGVVYYAFMFLLTVAVVAQFIVLCFQTIDYAGTYSY
jgi:hypothetical protein